MFDMCKITFDGYPTDGGNTKTAERLRRSKKYVSADVLFVEINGGASYAGAIFSQ